MKLKRAFEIRARSGVGRWLPIIKRTGDSCRHLVLSFGRRREVHRDGDKISDAQLRE